jgi:aryl-alcohol dehydrogenase-like predicted oxidoreductase
MTVGRRLLGRTGRTVSELGFGCGGLWASRWIGDQAAIDLIHQAIELGITLFDTGHDYGNGRSEERLGRALRAHRHRLDRLTFSTKLGAVKVGRMAAGPWGMGRDFTPNTIEAQLVDSLERLGVDHIPLVSLDRPDPAHLTEDLLDTLIELKRQGFIGLIGVTGHPLQIEAALDTGVFDVIMPTYNPLDRTAEPVIARAASEGLGVIGAQPLARMAFNPSHGRTWSSPAPWWYGARRLAYRLTAREDAARARQYRYLDRVKGWSAAQACLGFVLHNPDVHATVFGTTDAAHLAEDAAVSGRRLGAAVIAKIEATA